MEYVSLQEIKKQCNVDEGFTDDDAYLAGLTSVAQKVVENDICHPLAEFEDDEGNIPEDLRHCILLMAANLYMNREPVAFSVSMEVPLSYRYLLQPYVDYAG